MSKTSSILRQAGLALLLSLILLGLSELLVRKTLTNPSAIHAHPRYGAVMEPGATIVHSTEGYSINRLNSLGLFDEEPRDDTTHRILLIGDSYAEAKQVSRSQTFARLLEEKIDGLEIVNAGQSGRTPVQSSYFAEDYAPKLNPDLVVLQVNDGDIGDLIAGTGAGNLGGGEDHPIRKIMRKSALFTLLVRRTSFLVNTERSRLNRKFSPPENATRISLEIPPVVEERLRESLTRIRATGSDVVFLYIPLIEYSDGELRLKWPARHQFYVDFCEANGVRLVDPTEAFFEAIKAEGQPIHGFQNSVMGWGHINKRGHRVVAEAAAPILREALR